MAIFNDTCGGEWRQSLKTGKSFSDSLASFECLSRFSDGHLAIDSVARRRYQFRWKQQIDSSSFCHPRHWRSQMKDAIVNAVTTKVHDKLITADHHADNAQNPDAQRDVRQSNGPRSKHRSPSQNSMTDLALKRFHLLSNVNDFDFRSRMPLNAFALEILDEEKPADNANPVDPQLSAFL
jgi:hypothetical protein